VKQRETETERQRETEREGRGVGRGRKREKGIRGRGMHACRREQRWTRRSHRELCLPRLGALPYPVVQIRLTLRII
jgi:hypothetical protein